MTLLDSHFGCSGGHSIRDAAPIALWVWFVTERYRCHERPAAVARKQPVWFDLPDDTTVRTLCQIVGLILLKLVRAQ